MENKKLILSCLIGGFLMIISSLIGNFIFYEYPFHMGAPLIGEEANSNYSKIMFIFEYLTMYGGILIIIGLLIIELEYTRIGVFTLSLGIVLGLIGLVIATICGIIIVIISNNFLLTLIVFICFYGGFSITGIMITINERLKFMKNK